MNPLPKNSVLYEVFRSEVRQLMKNHLHTQKHSVHKGVMIMKFNFEKCCREVLGTLLQNLYTKSHRSVNGLWEIKRTHTETLNLFLIIIYIHNKNMNYNKYIAY